MKVESIASQLLFTTTRIDAEVAGGTSHGTGFFCAEMVNGRQRAFLVTNRHVVEGANQVFVHFTRERDGGPDLGQKIRFSFDRISWDKIWCCHPLPEVDVAVCDLEPIIDSLTTSFLFKPFYRSVDSRHFFSSAHEDKIDAIERVIFIGYPESFWDAHNNLPIVRQGLTASHALVDFDNQPQFIVDASIYRGSSGSPVFVLRQGSWAEGNQLKLGEELILLGVLGGAKQKKELIPLITSAGAPIQNHFALRDVLLDLGIVYKARTISETIAAYVARDDFKYSNLGAT